MARRNLSTSAWSATASWAGRTPTPTRKVNDFFDLDVPAGAQGGLRAATPARRKAFADNWGYESIETDWRKLVERKDIDAIDICTPNNTHAEIAIAAAEAGKMILCEKPLAMDLRRGPEDGRGGREGRACRTWSGTTTAACRPSRSPSSSIDEGRLGRIFHYRANFLQDWTISRRPAAGRRRRSGGSTSAAAGSGRHRRPARPLHRHGPLAQRRASTTCRAMTETFIKERKHNLTGKVEKVGIDDACAFLCRFDNGSLGHLRIDPLRPRPQGALHASRSTARTPRSSGTCTTCTGCSTSTTATRASSAAGGRSTSPTATIPT